MESSPKSPTLPLPLENAKFPVPNPRPHSNTSRTIGGVAPNGAGADAGAQVMPVTSCEARGPAAAHIAAAHAIATSGPREITATRVAALTLRTAAVHGIAAPPFAGAHGIDSAHVAGAMGSPPHMGSP